MYKSLKVFLFSTQYTIAKKYQLSIPKKLAQRFTIFRRQFH